MTEPLEKTVNIIINTLDPEKIILFGSRARGDFDNESDYDIFILKEGIINLRKILI
jgi:predicted nucleotidyltransferase